jgi:SAM-dependent methyltransferase
MESYRVSHLGREKAISYDGYFRTNSYRRTIWKLEQGILKTILKELPERDHLTHLDYACGPGRILSFMSQRGFRSWGVDISPDMIAVAQANCPEAKLAVGDITAQDMLEDLHFDLITVFRFFPNAEQELREDVISRLVKHLKPGGIFVFNNHLCLNSVLHRISRLRGRGGNVGMAPSEAERLISYAGLEIRKVFHLGVLPVYENWHPLPAVVTLALEYFASKIPLAKGYSQNLIYACVPRR